MFDNQTKLLNSLWVSKQFINYHIEVYLKMTIIDLLSFCNNCTKSDLMILRGIGIVINWMAIGNNFRYSLNRIQNFAQFNILTH